MNKEKQIIESLLSDTGITINGTNPFDPQVHNENFYHRVTTWFIRAWRIVYGRLVGLQTS